MGIILPKPILSKVVEREGNPHVSAAICSINGYRNTMEDAHVMMTLADRMIFGVFDGHSNALCSAYVAKHLPAKLKELPFPLTDKAIEAACLAVDQDFVSAHSDGGTTGIFAIIEPKADGKYETTVCNVGDSRLIAIQGGELKFVTEDHKPMNPTERQRIERCGGTVRANRVDGDLAVSRAFGDATFKTNAATDLSEQRVIAVPEITRLTLSKGDRLVIACDGVFEGNFPTEDVVGFVKTQMPAPGDDLGVVAARVVDQATRCGSKDNITCMVVEFTDGVEAVNKHGQTSFVPGPPYSKNHDPSRTAYGHMASLAGVPLSTALAQRYSLFKHHVAGTLGTLPPIQRVAFEMSEPSDIELEKVFFGNGPSGSEEDQATWFESLAEGA